jgi:hypothetical protein
MVRLESVYHRGGALGSEAARELIARGLTETPSLSRAAGGGDAARKIEDELGYYLTMTDEGMKAHLSGCVGFRLRGRGGRALGRSAPIYDLFRKDKVAPSGGSAPGEGGRGKARGVWALILLF